jgi:Ca2+-binding RTX toxin-like protein
MITLRIGNSNSVNMQDGFAKALSMPSSAAGSTSVSILSPLYSPGPFVSAGLGTGAGPDLFRFRVAPSHYEHIYEGAIEGTLVSNSSALFSLFLINEVTTNNVLDALRFYVSMSPLNLLPVLSKIATQSVTIIDGSKSNYLAGMGRNDVLEGHAGDDTLAGLGGDDTLDGGAGADRLMGGGGDDTYLLNGIDTFFEKATNGGTDTVISARSHTLAANVENLVLTGSGNLSGTGNNGSDNKITGNGGNNTLSGLNGDDTLSGGGGHDFLSGGNGNDILKGSIGNDTLEGASGNDTIQGGTGGDRITGGTGGDFIDVGSGIASGDTVVYNDFGEGAAAGANTGFDFITSFVWNEDDNISFGGAAAAALDDDDGSPGFFEFVTDAAADFTDTLLHEALLLTEAVSDADLFASGFGAVLDAINGVGGGAGVTSAVGEDGLIVVQGTSDTGIYYFLDAASPEVNIVTANELTLIAIVDNALLDETNFNFLV